MSGLSARPLLVGVEKDDWYVSSDGERGPEIRHKIGGRPRVLAAELASEGERLLGQGFVQVLQLGTPGGLGDAPGSGSWPFADGNFHLFGREPFGAEDWAWFWEN
jgi:hypothetical protein